MKDLDKIMDNITNYNPAVNLMTDRLTLRPIPKSLSERIMQLLRQLFLLESTNPERAAQAIDNFCRKNIANLTPKDNADILETITRVQSHAATTDVVKGVFAQMHQFIINNGIVLPTQANIDAIDALLSEDGENYFPVFA